MPEFKDPVFAQTSLKSSFSMSSNGEFGLVFAKTGSMNLGTEERELSSVDFGIRGVLGYGLAITLSYPRNYHCPW